MSSDLNSIIAKPQTNVVTQQTSIDKSQPLATTSVNNGPVLQQSAATDVFKKEANIIELKSGNILDQILKYSGVAALVLTPVAILVSHKMKTNNFSQNNITTQVNEIVNKALGDITKQLENGKVSLEGVTEKLNELTNKNETIFEYLNRIRSVLSSSAGIDVFTGKPMPTAPKII